MQDARFDAGEWSLLAWLGTLPRLRPWQGRLVLQDPWGATTSRGEASVKELHDVCTCAPHAANFTVIVVEIRGIIWRVVSLCLLEHPLHGGCTPFVMHGLSSEVRHRAEDLLEEEGCLLGVGTTLSNFVEQRVLDFRGCCLCKAAGINLQRHSNPSATPVMHQVVWPSRALCNASFGMTAPAT